MKVLSVIVPSYNSQQFLDKIIPSFLEETVMDKLEILIVNDGSRDDTAKVAQKYCDNYPDTVRLISQENKGHGGALNTGFAAATGKYLRVVDADDWVETENLPAYLEALENCESDVVLTHYYTRDISTGETKKWMSYPETFGESRSLGEIMADWKSYDRVMTLHGITYRTDFYRNRGIRLSEHVFYEDNEYAAIPCCYAQSITPLDLFIYDYRVGDVNQSVSDTNQLKRIGHVETVLERLISEYRCMSLPEGDPGREYICMKAKILLLSYFSTALLVEKDKKSGRARAKQMLERFRKEMPRVWELSQKQYRAFLFMNALGIRKATLDKVLSSGVYRRLKGHHKFD